MEFSYKIQFHFSVPLLCQLLESRLSRLHGQIQRLVQHGSMEIDKVLGDLYEDIHWILLISGNVLTLDTDGETTLIPPEIMRYSLGKSSEVNVETSLRVLASPGEPSSSIPGKYTYHITGWNFRTFTLTLLKQKFCESNVFPFFHTVHILMRLVF